MLFLNKILYFISIRHSSLNIQTVTFRNNNTSSTYENTKTVINRLVVKWQKIHHVR